MINWLKKHEDVLWLPGMLILGWSFWWFFFGAGEKENNKNVNPQIHAAFRQVEARCGAETFETQTVKCKALQDFNLACAKTERMTCMADEYYNKLIDVGFSLPDYYIPGYKPK